MNIIIEEQGLRDGLQTLARVIPTAQKVDWAERLVAAGLRRIQLASFVHPKLVPQMADAEAVFQQIRQEPGVVYSALVLNTKGLERALACHVRHLAISLSASEQHSQKNARMTIAEAMADCKSMIALARQHGIKVRGGIQCAFGCRYEGQIPEKRVLSLAKHLLDAGADELALADSTGMGHPYQVRHMMAQVRELCQGVPVALHLHDTESKGYANMMAAIDAGITQFDTAFGGLGGCPFIKGATGNIATEDVVHMLHQMGFKTGIELPKVAEISREMATILGHALPGKLYALGVA